MSVSDGPATHHEGMHHEAAHEDSARRPRVVIVGSGFGGLFAARALRRADVDVTLVARTAHHLFQPLLYQVATGILSSGEIAPATREVLADQRNVTVLLGDVTEIDLAKRQVIAYALGLRHVHEYDYLIVAAGADQSWFGNDEFADHAPGMKSIDDAFELRGRIFDAFELAELAAAQGREEALKALTTFVVIGAGPTGVEMAGQLAEVADRTLRRDFRHIQTEKSRIILLDAAPELLGSFHEDLQRAARAALEELGIEVHLGAKVVDVDIDGLVVEDGDGQRRRIEAVTKVWAAGVAASPLAKQLADQVGINVDRQGRIPVQPDLTVPGHPEVFVVGDMMALDKLPGVAQVAIQGARYAARRITAEVRRARGLPATGTLGRIRGAVAARLGRKIPEDGAPFHYHDKGSMATISRFNAIAQVDKIHLTGFLAWVAWLVVHLVYVVGFKNRVTTLLHWATSFIGKGRASRAFTEQQVFARLALQNRPAPHIPWEEPADGAADRDTVADANRRRTERIGDVVSRRLHSNQGAADDTRGSDSVAASRDPGNTTD